MSTSGPIPTGNTYDKYGTSNPIERRLVEGFLVRLEDCLRGLDAVESVLDVGCGEGYVSARVRDCLPDASYCALDIDEELVKEFASRNPDVGCVVATANALPYVDNQFDVVLALEVLEHLDDPKVALAEIARVSRHAAIISVPNEPLWRVLNMARGAYLAALGNTPGHIHHWGSRGFRRLVETELEVIRVFRPLPWLMALCRTSSTVAKSAAQSRQDAGS